MNNLRKRSLSLLVMLMLGSPAQATDSNSHQQAISRGNNEASATPTDAVFHGELVEDPCIIDPSGSDLDVDLQRRESAFFYNHPVDPVTTPIPFKLTLADCDLTLGKTVKITLTGDPDLDEPGLLKIKGTAKGIAIGLDSTQDGTITAMPVNQQATSYQLKGNGVKNVLTFQAYLKGKKDAIENKTIEEGDYSAMIQFGLEYE